MARKGKMEGLFWFFAPVFAAAVLLLLAGVFLLIELWLWRRRGQSAPWGRALGAGLGLFLAGFFGTWAGYYSLCPPLMLAGLFGLGYAAFLYIRTWVVQRAVRRGRAVIEPVVETEGVWPPPPNTPSA